MLKSNLRHGLRCYQITFWREVHGVFQHLMCALGEADIIEHFVETMNFSFFPVHYGGDLPVIARSLNALFKILARTFGNFDWS